jgi:predicted dehydrogenase
MKVGVIGAGRILATYLEASEHSDIEIAALCDVGDPVLPEGAGQLPLFTDLRDMAKLPHLDAFIIAVPSSIHSETAQLALETGRPLLIEKPVALEPQQFDQLRDMACAKATPVFSLLHAQYGAEVLAARKYLLEMKGMGCERLSVDWHTLLCDPYEGNAVVQSSLINAWVDGGINAISIVLAALPGAYLTRVSGTHCPDNEEWAQQKSQQIFEVSGEWAGTVTIETDWSRGHGIKTSHAQLNDGTRLDLHHTNEAIEIAGQAMDLVRCFQNERSRLANHYVEAFRDACQHIKQGRSNWGFSHACHAAYFSSFP